MGYSDFDLRPVLWGLLVVGMVVGVLAWELLSWVFSHLSIGWLS